MTALLNDNPVRTRPASMVPPVAVGQCLLLEDTDWSSYEAIGVALGDRANLRTAYDSGSLEIMVLSSEHERLKVLLGILIQVLAEETARSIAGFGSTTYKRDVLNKGLEPDLCYYHDNLHRVRGKRRIDLAIDPPPDLAIEIDVSYSSLDRVAIYERLGVPELWRLKDETITVYQRNAAGHYETRVNSPSFPMLPLDELARFLIIGLENDDIDMARQFRGWIRQRLDLTK